MARGEVDGWSELLGLGFTREKEIEFDRRDRVDEINGRTDVDNRGFRAFTIMFYCDG